MANYDFYLARSKPDSSTPTTAKTGFHFRSAIIQDGDKGNPPFVKIDTAHSDPISVSIAHANGTTTYTVSVRLEETSALEALPSEDFIFY